MPPTLLGPPKKLLTPNFKWQTGVMPSATSSDFAIKDLEASDFDRGFLECLAHLTTVGDISREAFEGSKFRGRFINLELLLICNREIVQIAEPSGTFQIESRCAWGPSCRSWNSTS